MSNRFVTVREAKARFSELAQRAVEGHERIRITKNGKPYVVLVSEEEWNGAGVKGGEETVGEALGDVIGAWAGPEHDYWDDILEMLKGRRAESRGQGAHIVPARHRSLHSGRKAAPTRREAHRANK